MKETVLHTLTRMATISSVSSILMIDDDEKLVSLVRDYLEPHGFTFSGAYDGKQGLVMSTTVQPDLVILDLMLPELDGLDVCRHLRAQSQVPILMLTARGEETDRIVGLELGADDYLAKPFNPRELLARIRAILRRAGADDPVGPQSTVVVGPLEIDQGARQVKLEGRAVTLTSAEFDLLWALASRTGRVLSRNQLMEHLHGNDAAAFDRSIDVHISRIRQKIEMDPRQPKLLKTVRSVGYQLVRPGDQR